MPTITPDPIDAATPPDGELVLNVPIEIRALKARVNALAGLPADTANYYRRNLLDNGSFQVNTRRYNVWDGVSVAHTTASKLWLRDRWVATFSANVTATIAQTDYASVTSPIKRSVSLNCSSAITPQAFYISQKVLNARRLEGKTLTLSGHLSVPAAVLAAGAGTVTVVLNYGTGGTPSTQVTLGGYTFTASGPQTFEITFDVPATVDLTEYGTNANDYIQVLFNFYLVQNQPVQYMYVQLEEGAAASPFELLSFEEDLFHCQHHFRTSYSYGVKIGAVSSAGAERCIASGTAVTDLVCATRFSPPLRAAPTVTIANPEAVDIFNRLYKDDGGLTPTAVASNIGTSGFFTITLGSAAVKGDSYSFHWTADAEVT